MPRKSRIHVAGGIYHVVLRGNACEPIFFREQDRRYLNRSIAQGLQRYECRLHAFCWMTTHLHAAIQVANRPLSDLMCWLAARYARQINRSRNRTGHLFERRHRAELVVDDAYLLNLVRYIHRNPVAAGMVDEPGQYPWSSHRAYLGIENLHWLTTRAVLSCFAESLSKARTQYRAFMSDHTDWTPDTNEPAKDERLSYDELSVGRLDASYERRLNRLVEEYCAVAGVEPATLVVRGKQRKSARLRAWICDAALRNGHATLGELATYFGRAPEVIARGIARYRQREGHRKPD